MVLFSPALDLGNAQSVEGALANQVAFHLRGHGRLLGEPVLARSRVDPVSPRRSPRPGHRVDDRRADTPTDPIGSASYLHIIAAGEWRAGPRTPGSDRS